MPARICRHPLRPTPGTEWLACDTCRADFPPREDHPPMTDTSPADGLRDRLDAAIRPNMLIGLQDAELDGPGGTRRIHEWADWILDAVLKQLAEQPPLAEAAPNAGLREEYAQAMAEAAGSKAFREPGTEWDHARAAWLVHADAVLAVRDAAMERQRTELVALKEIARGYCPECGRGDCSPTAAQWYRERQRADRAEAAIVRVRDACDAIDRDVHGKVPTALAGLRHAASLVRATLDQPQEHAR